MKSYRKELWFNAPTRVAFINITRDVQECLRESDHTQAMRGPHADGRHARS